MLDVRLEELSVDEKDFRLRVESLTVPASSHFALAGPPRAGKSLLLHAISGRTNVSGKIYAGAREVTKLKPSARPLLHTRFDAAVPERWSVQRSLLNALHQRKLDRAERFDELERMAATWNLTPMLGRRISELSSGCRLRARLARIEIMRPAVLLAERLFEEASATERSSVVDQFFRAMRVIGTTILSEPAHVQELGYADRVVVLADGEVLRVASPRELAESPRTVVEAEVAGEVNAIPARAHDGTVSSPIGDFEIDDTTDGEGTLLVRPESLRVATAGEESDFIVTIDEAIFRRGSWLVTAYVSGGTPLRLELAANAALTRGRPLAIVVRRGEVRFVRT